MHSKKSLFAIALVLFLISCGLEVPVKEMTSAKRNITIAKAVEANTYAQTEFEAAQQMLIEAHSLVAEKKTDDAKDKAREARDMAKKARATALPKRAMATIKSAKKELSTANGLVASEFAPTEYTKAKATVNSAIKLYNAKEYEKSYTEALNAINDAKNAQTAALKKIPELQKEISTLNKRVADNKSKPSGSFGKSDFTRATTSLKNANSELEKKNLKSGYTQLHAARTAISAGESKMARGAIALATKEISSAQRIMAEKFAPNSFSAATKELEAAKSSFSKKEYLVAVTQAEKAEELAKKTAAETIAKIPAMETKIADLRDALKEHELAGGKEYAPTQLLDGEEALKAAQEALATKKLDVANNNITQAEKALAEADVLGHTYLVKKKIETAKETYNTSANDKTFAAKFKDDLTKAKGEIEEATIAFNDGEIDTADKKADDALATLDAMLIAGGSNGGDIDNENRGEQQEYTVVLDSSNRDCLWKIAQRFYKKADLWPLIYAANRDQIKDPDLIFPGQKFVIPSKDGKKKSDNSTRATDGEVVSAPNRK